MRLLNRERWFDGYEWVKCYVCRVQVLVQKSLNPKEVMRSKDLFVCPNCLSKTDVTKWREKKAQ